MWFYEGLNTGQIQLVDKIKSNNIQLGRYIVLYNAYNLCKLEKYEQSTS